MAKDKEAAGEYERGAKTRAARDYLKANPKTSSKDVVAALAATGMVVSEALVNNIKYGGNAKKKTKGSKRGRPAGSTNAASASSATVGRSSSNSAGNYEFLIEVKKLADKLGGVDNARKALDVIAQLQ